MAALSVAPAAAATLTHRYEGQPLALDEAAAFAYLRELLKAGSDLSEETGVAGAINLDAIAPFQFEVVIDERLVPGQTVKGQTLSLHPDGDDRTAPFVKNIRGLPITGESAPFPYYAVPNYATRDYRMTFDETGRVVEWSLWAYHEGSDFGSNSGHDTGASGDVYRVDLSSDGYFSAVGRFLTWHAAAPGTWTLASDEPSPAPVPLPASLPLLAAGLGLVAALRRGRRPSP